MTPSTQHFIDRMRREYPAYGDQEHQRKFIERLEWMQINYPCTKGCEEHIGCYEQKVLDAAYVWQRNGGKL